MIFTDLRCLQEINPWLTTAISVGGILTAFYAVASQGEYKDEQVGLEINLFLKLCRVHSTYTLLETADLFCNTRLLSMCWKINYGKKMLLASLEVFRII